MKFYDYLTLKEANETQEIDVIFNQASTDIKTLFTQLYQGTSGMVKNYEKAQFPEEMRRQIIQDLSRIAQKIRGDVSNKTMIDPRGQGKSLSKSENVTVDTFIKDIDEQISAIYEVSPSIIQDMGSHGIGIGGKPAYDFKSTLTNTYRLVMDRMTQLKDAVLKHMGIIRDTHGRTGEIQNMLKNPVQPFSKEEADAAEDSMIELARLQQLTGNLKLVDRNGKTISIDPRSENWKKQVLQSNDKRFKLIANVGGKQVSHDINMGNRNDIYRITNMLQQQAGISGLPPDIKRTSGNKLRALKLREPK